MLRISEARAESRRDAGARAGRRGARTHRVAAGRREIPRTGLRRRWRIKGATRAIGSDSCRRTAFRQRRGLGPAALGRGQEIPPFRRPGRRAHARARHRRHRFPGAGRSHGGAPRRAHRCRRGRSDTDSGGRARRRPRRAQRISGARRHARSPDVHGLDQSRQGRQDSAARRTRHRNRVLGAAPLSRVRRHDHPDDGKHRALHGPQHPPQDRRAGNARAAHRRHRSLSRGQGQLLSADAGARRRRAGAPDRRVLGRPKA